MVFFGDSGTPVASGATDMNVVTTANATEEQRKSFATMLAMDIDRANKGEAEPRYWNVPSERDDPMVV